jgi:hypothetical protein
MRSIVRGFGRTSGNRTVEDTVRWNLKAVIEVLAAPAMLGPALPRNQ